MNQLVNPPAEPSFQLGDAASQDEKELDLFDEDAWNDRDDVDPFSLSRARSEADDKLLQTEPSDELPIPLKLEKLVIEQRSGCSVRT